MLSSLHDRAGPPRGKERGVLTHREGRDLLSALSPAVHAYGEAVQQRLQDRVSLTFNAPGTLSAGASAVASMQRAVAEIHNAVRGGQGSATISESVAGHVARTLR